MGGFKEPARGGAENPTRFSEGRKNVSKLLLIRSHLLLIFILFFNQNDKKKTSETLHKLNDACNLLEQQLEEQKKQQDKLLKAEISSRYASVSAIVNLPCVKVIHSNDAAYLHVIASNK